MHLLIKRKAYADCCDGSNQSKPEVLFRCTAPFGPSLPNKTSDNILIIAQQNCACKHYFQKNISAKDIDILPKEAYNKCIGSERIREKPKGELK